jgi:colanic acid biosynthesis glycosyl transferase WcaI
MWDTLFTPHMKILLLNQTFHPDQTATSQQLVDLARFLKARGCDVSVVASQRAYEAPEKRFTRYEEWNGVHIYRVGSTGFGKRSFLHRMVDGFTFELSLLWRLLRVPRHDVVISFTSPPLIGVLGALVCKLRRSRSVQWLMDVNPDAAIAVGYLKENSWAAKFLTSIFNWSLRQSDLIIVLDRWMREKIQAHGVPAEKIAIIPPWPVHEPPVAFEEGLGESFRRANGLSGKFVVLYSGNHSIVHPLDTLLNSALKMRDRKEVVFLFIGGGLRAVDVREFKSKHGLENIVQLPHQPRTVLRESLASGDLHVVVMGDAVAGLVHTSKIYGVLATGRPYIFIGPAKSHVSDLISACPYGFQVENGNVEGTIRTIDKARSLSREDREHYSRQNIGYLKKHCLPEHSFKEIERVLLSPSSDPVRHAVAASR